MSKLSRFSSTGTSGRIDRERGIIYGVSVITGNREATGHGKWIDDVMLNQVFEHGATMGNDGGPGVKARFDHPNPCSDSMGKAVGRFKNFQKDGEQVRADLHLLETANKGEIKYSEYLLDLAEEDPGIFATSIVFKPAESEVFEPGENDDPEAPEFKYPHARVEQLTHVDVVDEGAANDGLFGSPELMAAKIEQFFQKQPIAKKVLSEIVREEINKQLGMSQEPEKKSLWSSLTAAFPGLFKTADEPSKEELDSLSDQLAEFKSEAEKTIKQLESDLAEAKKASELKVQELSTVKQEFQSKLAEVEAKTEEPKSPEDKGPDQKTKALSAQEKAWEANAESLKTRKL